jgi:hypothetical protein
MVAIEEGELTGGNESLSPDIARDTIDSHACPSDAPIQAQTLGRLSVSRRLG